MPEKDRPPPPLYEDPGIVAERAAKIRSDATRVITELHNFAKILKSKGNMDPVHVMRHTIIKNQ